MVPHGDPTRILLLLSSLKRSDVVQQVFFSFQASVLALESALIFHDIVGNFSDFSLDISQDFLLDILLDEQHFFLKKIIF